MVPDGLRNNHLQVLRPLWTNSFWFKITLSELATVVSLRKDVLLWQGNGLRGVDVIVGPMGLPD